jgi:hypothetical protein
VVDEASLIVCMHWDEACVVSGAYARDQRVRVVCLKLILVCIYHK